MAKAAISLYEGRMKVRSIVVAFALAACAFVLSASGVRAAYPDRIIKIVVPFAPGGGTDVVARTLAQEMAKDLGVSIIIENKPGAGTIIGTQAVAASEGDGYTLLMGTFANAVNPDLKHMAQVNLTTVPYKGAAPSITDLIGGQIQLMFTTVASCASLVEGGQLRALAVDLGPELAGIPELADGRRGRRARL
jgi:tripartite-type tricarboxylate transporter receptor subunit TctC